MLRWLPAWLAASSLLLSVAWSGEAVAIAKLSEGAEAGTLGRTTLRLVGEYRFRVLPEELAGLPCVAMPRGDIKQPGRGFSFDIDRDGVVYLLVHDMPGKPLEPKGWARTELATEWQGHQGVHTDTVWMRRFPKGTVTIPSHTVKKENGTYGIPHLAAIALKEIKIEAVPSPLEAMTAVGKVKPRRSADIEASPLSVGFETLDRRMFEPDRTYKQLAQLGVKWARVQTGWARTETVKGAYDFAWLDDVVSNLLRIGVRPWFSLSYGNRLYTPEAPDESAVGWVPIFDDAAKAGWLRYTRAIARRYRDRVGHYEIWNEPNHSGAFWKPKKPNAAEYVELIRLTAPVIREEVPKAVIIGGAFAGMPTPYLEESLEAGMGGLVDRVSYHPYRTVPEGGGYESTLAKWRAMLAKHNPKLRLWQGENGAPSQPGGVGAMGTLPWTEQRQAKWVTRRILTDLRLGVELTSYFHLADLVNYNWGRGGTGKTNFKGLLRGTDYTPKPSFFAYQCLCALFDSHAVPSDGKLSFAAAADGPTLDDPGKVWWATFGRDGKALCAYWLPADLFRRFVPRRVVVTLSCGKGVSLGRPVLIDPLTSTVYRIEGAASQDGTWHWPNLPLLDYPLLVADEALVAD